jgi:hypothetical protein
MPCPTVVSLTRYEERHHMEVKIIIGPTADTTPAGPGAFAVAFFKK